MTLVGAPSLPGARSYPDVYPLSFTLLRLGRGSTVRVRTPLAAGNIAVFSDRWGLIESDTLPDYLTFIDAQDGAAVRALVATPIAERVGEFRILRRARGLLVVAARRSRVSIGPAPPRRPDPRPARVAIDLRGPPTRAELGIDDSVVELHRLASSAHSSSRILSCASASGSLRFPESASSAPACDCSRQRTNRG